MRRILAWILLFFMVDPALPALATETFRKSGSGYFIDKNGDFARDTDGTEPFADFQHIEVPGDYATVQAALDSEDCKKGSSSGGANQGCHIFVHGTYAESFEIGGIIDADLQNSVVIEGPGPAGVENGANHQQCGATFTGSNTANETIIKVNGAIGWSLKNICIDMDEQTNKAKYGLAIGYGTTGSESTKHGLVENVTIEDGTVSGGAGIIIGAGSATSDTAFNLLRNVRIETVPTCIVVDGAQAVANIADDVECVNPTATIGGVSYTSNGGELKLFNFYMTPGIDSQIGINIRNESIGPGLIVGSTFEWDKDNGTFINFDATGGNAGAYRVTTILGGRFQPQTAAGTRHVCVAWNRQGSLNIEGVSFESANVLYTCEFDFSNPSASKTSDVYFTGNDIEWNATQSDPRVTRATAGGAMRIAALDGGSVFTCSGAASVGSLNSSATGCAAGSGGGLASTDIDTSAELKAILTDETGSGAACFATSPTLVTPALGTPSAVVLTSGTGLPISTGVSGLGTGVATVLATPSSANLAAAITNETGSGLAVFATSPTLTTPALGDATATSITTGTSAASCMMYRDTDTAGYTECFWLNGVQSCSIDADGVCDGA